MFDLFNNLATNFHDKQLRNDTDAGGAVIDS